MPFGFSDYLLKEGYKEKTINTYTKNIEMFFQFINKKYGSNKEVYTISSNDLKMFLEDKKSHVSETTLYKILVILKSFFDFLWKLDKIPVDPAMKIKLPYPQNKKTKKLNYKDLINLQESILENPKYKNFRKIVYFMSSLGVRQSELLFTKNDVSIFDTHVLIETKNRLLKLEGPIVPIFIEYYYSTLLDDSEYVLHSFDKNGNCIELDNRRVTVNLHELAKDYGLPPFNLTDARIAYAMHIYNENRNIDEVANELGIERYSAAMLIKKNNSDVRSIEII